MTLDCGNCGIFLTMGNAGFLSSTVAVCRRGSADPNAGRVVGHSRPQSLKPKPALLWLSSFLLSSFCCYHGYFHCFYKRNPNSKAPRHGNREAEAKTPKPSPKLSARNCKSACFGDSTMRRRGSTHRLHSSSFLGLPYRIPNMNPKKELLWSPWVEPLSASFCWKP